MKRVCDKLCRFVKKINSYEKLDIQSSDIKEYKSNINNQCDIDFNNSSNINSNIKSMISYVTLTNLIRESL